MISLLVFAMVSQGGAGLDDRGCGFFGGPITADMCLPDDISMGWGEGTTAACGDEDYEIIYNSSGTQLEFRSLDCGSGTCAWMSVPDGTDDPVFSGSVTLTAGPLAVTSDTNGINLGAGGASDTKLFFDGTNFRLQCAVCTGSEGFVFDAPIITGPREGPTNGGAVLMDDMPVTDAVSDGDEMAPTYGVDGNAILKLYTEANGTGGVDTFRAEFFDENGDGLYWREFHMEANKVSPGVTGATLTTINTATLVWLLNTTDEYLYFGFDVHPDWDATSDMVIDIRVMISGAAESANDIINGEVICEYFTEHDDADTSVKTQTRTVNHNITTDNAQGKAHDLVFILDYDLASNVIEVHDSVACRFRLDAVAGGTDVAAVWFGFVNARYRTKEPAINRQAIFPSEG